MSGARLNFNLRQVVDEKYTFERAAKEREEASRLRAHKQIKNAASEYGAKVMAAELSAAASPPAPASAAASASAASATSAASPPASAITPQPPQDAHAQQHLQAQLQSDSQACKK